MQKIIFYGKIRRKVGIFMNSPEYMMGTNRVVVKLDDNSKVIVTRELVNDKVNYMVKTTQDISYALSDLALDCGYIIMLHGLNIDDDVVTVEGMVVENMALKEEYHIINGNEFGKFIESYVPYPEEAIRVSSITLCFEDIKEMTGDLDMIQEMVNENILSVSTADLIKYGIIIKPQLQVLNTNKNSDSDSVVGDNTPSVLTVINGRSKVKKK